MLPGLKGKGFAGESHPEEGVSVVRAPEDLAAQDTHHMEGHAWSWTEKKVDEGWDSSGGTGEGSIVADDQGNVVGIAAHPCGNNKARVIQAYDGTGIRDCFEGAFDAVVHEVACEARTVSDSELLPLPLVTLSAHLSARASVSSIIRICCRPSHV